MEWTILRVDIRWPEAAEVFEKMMNANRKGHFLSTLLYEIGIGAPAFASIPMIFEVNTVMWFNSAFVTSGIFPTLPFKLI